MIYCITQPLESYDDEFEVGSVGLVATYAHNPPLLNSIFLFSLLPFYFEPGTQLPVGERPAEVTKIQAFKDALGFENIQEMVSTETPVDIYQGLKNRDLEQFPISTIYPQGQRSVKTVLGARAAAWALNYRGIIRQKGNLVSAAFQKQEHLIDDFMQQSYEVVLESLKAA